MRVTVLTGGASAEREVALASAVQVIAALRSAGHRVSVVDTVRGAVAESAEGSLLPAGVGKTPPSVETLRDEERKFLLTTLGALPEIRQTEVLFLALHGGRGEDGTLQSLLQVPEIPYTGNGPRGSALRMDQDTAHHSGRGQGVPPGGGGRYGGGEWFEFAWK